MDPNLLPDNLRNKEGKEQAKLKKQPAGFGLELNLPQQEKKSRPARAAKGAGFWSKIFSSEIKPAKIEKLTEPTTDYTHSKSFDLLSPGSGIKDVPPTKAFSSKSKKPSGWLKNLFGRPVSPMVSHKAEEKLTSEHFQSRKYEPVAEEKKYLGSKPAAIQDSHWNIPAQMQTKTHKQSPKKQVGDSWSEIFKGMFNFSRRKRIDFRLASFGNDKKTAPVFAPMPQISKAKEFVPYHAVTAPTKHIESAKKTEKEKKHEVKEVKSAYHTVPKSEGHSGFNVNLMPEELLNQLKSDSAKNIQSIIIAIIIPVIIITIGYGAVILLQNDLKTRMIAKNIEFDKLNKQIGDYVIQEKYNNAVADRVTAIKKLLDEKIIWNNFFLYLESYTLDGVYFTDLTADTSGALILPGVAENYDVLAKQLAALRDADKFVKSVKLSSAQIISEGKAGVIGVGFQVRLILQDSVFQKTK
ncbi:MAG: hypothetical protein WCT26_01245 [Candidatus Buchananbacteria bacterium]|jgi:hypothetical protein